jgi:NADH:ubiquinone oxidoreductase subunit 6 (subunit J)
MSEMYMGPPAGGDLLGTIVVIVGAIATLYAFVVAVRTTFRPGETEAGHPKLLIFKDDR